MRAVGLIPSLGVASFVALFIAVACQDVLDRRPLELASDLSLPDAVACVVRELDAAVEAWPVAAERRRHRAWVRVVGRLWEVVPGPSHAAEGRYNVTVSRHGTGSWIEVRGPDEWREFLRPAVARCADREVR